MMFYNVLLRDFTTVLMIELEWMSLYSVWYYKSLLNYEHLFRPT